MLYSRCFFLLSTLAIFLFVCTFKHINVLCYICRDFLNYITILGAFAKFRKVTISFVMYVCPHETTLLPLDGFS